MESPVVVDKPPEYHGNDRGFPFEEEEGSGAWSELAARHPDIAARLRQRPATWARKRRPSSHDATDDFGDSFGSFDGRFPFDDIPSEFREHFPSHWNRRFGSRDEPQPTQTTTSPQPQQHTTATQTEHDTGHEECDQQTPLPQYGLRNTVDLGQKSPADPSLVDEDERTQRSMSAPPDTNNQTKMSGHNHQEQNHAPPPHTEQQSNVRHIPIFVEGRDEPVINKSVDHGAHYAEPKPSYTPHPTQQPHVEREQYFADDGPATFHPPPNFSRSFGTPFNKGFRQGSQPFAQQKVFPQTAYARGASPQRGQSPKPQCHPEEHYMKVPVHHEQSTPKTETPSRAQKSPQQQQTPTRPQQQPQSQQPPQQQHQAPQRETTPPPPKSQQPSANDPITLILSIQTDVLNLMTEVENFKGAKKDKKYLFLDEMLTRNLIKLDNIETDGKENIRQARKEAIKCIQKCIAVLEAKAESNATQLQQEPPQQQAQDVEIKENTDVQENVSDTATVEQQVTQNGEVDMKEAKETHVSEPENQVQPEPQADVDKTETLEKEDTQKEKEEPKTQEQKDDAPVDNNKTVTTEIKEVVPTQAVDTRPEQSVIPEEEIQPNLQEKENNEEKKCTPKKITKTVKKRDKSKDKKEESKDSNKEDIVEDNVIKTEEKKEKLEEMQVDDKVEKTDPQGMEVDGAASQ